MVHRSRRVVLWGAAFILCGLAPRTRGTTFVVPDTADLLAASDAVVVARVTGIRSVVEQSALRTHIQLGVEEALKGPEGSEMSVVEPGGLVGEQRRWVFGAPTFFVGERVLLFLHRNGRQEFETTFLGIGKFSVVRSSRGTDFAVRDLGEAGVFESRAHRLHPRSPVTTYEFEAFLDRLRSLGVLNAVPAQAPSTSTPIGSRWQENFTFSGPPLTRWFLPSDDQPIAYQVTNDGDGTLGNAASIEAADAALAAWSNVGCANLRLVDGGRALPSPFGECDGRTTIMFNDPFAELPDPVNCGGVLGVGGVCANTSTPESFDGALFYPVSEGDVVVNDGFGDCPFWNATNLSELLTHEVGHTLGLAHSSESPNEPDPSLRDATMYYTAHFDGRGATLMTDDVAALCTLYPAGRMGSVTLRRFAVISDVAGPSQRDRLVVDGVLNLDNCEFKAQTDTLILDVRAAGSAVFRLAIVPGEWMISASGQRLRYRRIGETGGTTLILSAFDPHALRFSLRTNGLDLCTTAAVDLVAPVTISLAFGDASVSQTIPALRQQAGIRIYP